MKGNQKKSLNRQAKQVVYDGKQEQVVDFRLGLELTLKL